MNRYFGSESLNRVLVAFLALCNLIWIWYTRRLRSRLNAIESQLSIIRTELEDRFYKVEMSIMFSDMHFEDLKKGLEDLEESEAKRWENDLCARCDHTRRNHFYGFSECSSCDGPICPGFVDISEYTKEMKQDWEKTIQNVFDED